MAIFVALILVIASAGGAEFQDTRTYNENELKKLLPAVVIAEIPPVVMPKELESQKRHLWLAGATACLVMMMMLAGTAVS